MASVLVEGLLVGCVYGLLGAGFSFSFGTARFINFFYGGIVLWGMYATLIGVTMGLPLPIVGVLAVASTAIAGLVLYWPVLRRLIRMPEELQIVATFGGLVVLVNIGQLFFRSDAHRAVGQWPVLRIGDVVAVRLSVVVAGLLAVIGLALVSWWLRSTPSGKQVRASTDNRLGAMLSGVNVDRSYTLGQVVCFGMAGLGGVLLMLFGVAFPARGFDLGVLAFVVAVLGGMGHVLGGAAAGLIVGLIDSVGRLFLPVALVPVLRAVLIIVVIAMRPRGLFGLGVMGKH